MLMGSNTIQILTPQADTPYLDDKNGAFGFSLARQLADLVENALNPSCSANVMTLLCRSWFKECVQVEDTSTAAQIWLPSMMCRSECDRHLDAWNKCLASLDEDPDAKKNFETQMMEVVCACVLLRSSLEFSFFPHYRARFLFSVRDFR
jgi:hypothetical protein